METHFVTIVVIAPESHADALREAMGRAGAGEIGNYTHCSFSVKGIGRFRPGEGAHPFIGEKGILEAVVEERIETVCRREKLNGIIDAIKKAHPYEEPVIDVYPVFPMGRKKL